MTQDDAYRAYIKRLVDQAPPLRPETLAAVRTLMAPGFAAVRAERQAAAEPGRRAA